MDGLDKGRAALDGREGVGMVAAYNHVLRVGVLSVGCHSDVL